MDWILESDEFLLSIAKHIPITIETDDKQHEQ